MTGHKEEVVISGIGGLFTESDNLEELTDLLFNKTNGITLDSRRWNPSTSYYIFNAQTYIHLKLIYKLCL